MSIGEDVIAGVGAGGLRDPHQMKILICYFLNTLSQPFPKERMAELFTAVGLTDYFTFSSVFDELAEMGHLKEEKSGWTLTPLGQKTAAALGGSLPASLRERAAREGERALRQLEREREVRTDIVPHQNGYHVRCVVGDGELEFLKLAFFAPDLEHAGRIRQQLQERSTEIYTLLMKNLT